MRIRLAAAGPLSSDSNKEGLCIMTRRLTTTRRTLPVLVLLGAAGLSACGSDTAGGSRPAAGQRPDATVRMQQIHAAYIGSGGGGSGTLQYRGRSYPFTVVSGGVGGIGMSTVDAVGEVYGLRNVSDFAGTYGQMRTGLALGSGSGEYWLQNSAGVSMHLHAERTGLMLSLGGDAVVITMP